MNSQVNNRDKWLFKGSTWNIINDKELLIKNQVMSMLNKTTRIFKYSNLPKTIPQKDLELILQCNGFAIWGKDNNGDLYVYQGSLGGEPNPYYLPTLAIVANPSLRLNKTYVIDEDCVVMLNDEMYQGLLPVINKYASLIIEGELSIKQALINARIPVIVTADNDTTFKSAKNFFEKIVKGEDFGVVSTTDFFEGIKTQDFTKEVNIKELVEALQYIKGSFYNEIGLNSAFNLKREYIGEAEATLNEDILYPTIDTMLKNRQNALDKINEMFGTNISVELDSVWKQNEVEEDLALEIMEKEASGESEVVSDEVVRNIDTDTDTKSTE